MSPFYGLGCDGVHRLAADRAGQRVRELKKRSGCFYSGAWTQTENSTSLIFGEQP